MATSETYDFSPQPVESTATHAKEEPEVFSVKKASETTMASPLLPATLDVRYEVAYRIGHSVSQVQALFTQLEGKSLRVWTVVPERDEAVYKSIYAKERELLNEFDGMEFEFNIIPSLGRDAKGIISDPGSKLVFER